MKEEKQSPGAFFSVSHNPEGLLLVILSENAAAFLFFCRLGIAIYGKKGYTVMKEPDIKRKLIERHGNQVNIGNAVPARARRFFAPQTEQFAVSN